MKQKPTAGAVLRLVPPHLRELLGRRGVGDGLVEPLANESWEAKREATLRVDEPDRRPVHGRDGDVGAFDLPHFGRFEPEGRPLARLDALGRTRAPQRPLLHSSIAVRVGGHGGHGRYGGKVGRSWRADIIISSPGSI
eukprot:2584166-Pleurochrysis_carterae.AAC.2